MHKGGFHGYCGSKTPFIATICYQADYCGLKEWCYGVWVVIFLRSAKNISKVLGFWRVYTIFVLLNGLSLPQLVHGLVEGKTLLGFNGADVALIEIVTQPST